MGDRQLVVIAEDEQQIADLIRFKLEKSGYEVIWGENGKLALELVSERRPDLVILDVMMPVMDGFEVLRLLKGDEDTRNIPVIMLTARGMEADVLRGFDTGAVDYLTKPFSVSELAARVKSILARGG
ncbi:MAG: response regulator [Actinobacteria bacterium]|nr:response regulator [Actinomycetota bacterium]MBU1943769.1 response regulator [Actinomycetota bacterium]MBU2688793.1 response regulator [Actinomycetota bacterium]